MIRIIIEFLVFVAFLFLCYTGQQMFNDWRAVNPVEDVSVVNYIID